MVLSVTHGCIHRRVYIQAKQMLPLGVISLTVIQDKSHSYLRYIYLRGLLCLWEEEFDCNLVSPYTPQLSPNQGLDEQGSAPDIWEKQLLAVCKCRVP